MHKTKFLILILAALSFSYGAHAQLGQCNSPYSRFGLGLMSEQSQGFNTAMSGVGIALSGGDIANYTNPASYAVIDSLSFILDVGMSLSAGNLAQSGRLTNIRNAHLDYVSAGFRICRGLGFSLGFLPYSRVGYAFSQEQIIARDPAHMIDITSTTSYGGEGGLRQVYAGIGWNPFAKLSIGINAGYLWGTCNHLAQQSFQENGATSTSFSPLIAQHLAELRTYNIDFGAQYFIQLNRDHALNVGAAATVGHRIKSDATLARNAGTTTTPVYTCEAPYDMPWKVGGGLAYLYKTSWMVAMDVKFERWGTCTTPAWNNDTQQLVAVLGEYQNSMKYVLGAQYVPDRLSSNYWKRMQYRAGLFYKTPHLLINGQDGPGEMGASAGVALPITSNRSVVNVGFRWLRRSAPGADMITENYYMMTIGLTFNEMWFMKFRIK
ncbi:MAG: hypothetical protein HUK03_03290 [Bacteroidaceae bacterium]|nr:hypothetical protein [Bacteroidaceae bacterium]